MEGVKENKGRMNKNIKYFDEFIFYIHSCLYYSYVIVFE